MLAAAAILILLLLALPVVILLPVALSSVGYLVFPPPGLSLRWFRQVFSDPRWLDSFGYSAWIALWVALLSLLLGLSASIALARGRLRAPALVFSILLSPLIVPTVITSIGLFFVFAQLRMVGTVWAIIIGQSVLQIPVTTILLTTSLRGLDPVLEQAANIHGASPVRTLRHVTLPLIAPGLVAAALFAYLGSFDELLVALFVGGPLRQTLPVRLWNTIQFELDPSVAAVSVSVTALAVLVLTIAGQLQARGRDTAS